MQKSVIDSTIFPIPPLVGFAFIHNVRFYFSLFVHINIYMYPSPNIGLLLNKLFW